MSERLGTHWETCWQSATHHGCALTRIASLERQLEDAKAQFRAETLRTSEYAVMIDKMIARLCVEHEPGAWSRSCESCALVLEARALRMKPININPLAEMQAQLAERTRERDAAIARAEAAEKDAGRLDWLDKQCGRDSGYTLMRLSADVSTGYAHKMRGPYTARAAIDAAMSGEEKPNANLP